MPLTRLSGGPEKSFSPAAARKEKHLSEPLSETQINYGRYLVEKVHPLADTHIEVVWPFLNYLCCCCIPKRKRRFKVGLRNSLRRKLDIPDPEDYEELQKDPFLICGYGINSYFELITQMFYLMLTISLVMGVFMFTFSSYFTGLASGGLYMIS